MQRRLTSAVCTLHVATAVGILLGCQQRCSLDPTGLLLSLERFNTYLPATRARLYPASAGNTANFQGRCGCGPLSEINQNRSLPIAACHRPGLRMAIRNTAADDPAVIAWRQFADQLAQVLQMTSTKKWRGGRITISNNNIDNGGKANLRGYSCSINQYVKWTYSRMARVISAAGT